MKNDKTTFIPTIIDPKKIDEIRKKDEKNKIGTCAFCYSKHKLELFQIDGQLICPKCGVEHTRVHFTMGFAGMGVVSTNDDAMANVLKHSRHNPNNKFDPIKYEESVDKFYSADQDEIITGIKKKEKET